MVSNTSDDLPEPETPVTTVRVLCGMSKSMFLRLWTRAPRTTMLSVAMGPSATACGRGSPPAPDGSRHAAESSYYTVRQGLRTALCPRSQHPVRAPSYNPPHVQRTGVAGYAVCHAAVPGFRHRHAAGQVGGVLADRLGGHLV